MDHGCFSTDAPCLLSASLLSFMVYIITAKDVFFSPCSSAGVQIICCCFLSHLNGFWCSVICSLHFFLFSNHPQFSQCAYGTSFSVSLFSIFYVTFREMPGDMFTCVAFFVFFLRLPSFHFLSMEELSCMLMHTATTFF